MRKPAVFLDRDGVLTEEKGYICSVEELTVFSYAAECVRQIHEKGYHAIMVTNQGGVAKGLFTEEELKEMNDYLQRAIGLDAVYYCPHHPEGKLPGYAVECQCRKPKTGMFENAFRDFDIDIENSFMIGDRAGDILAGRNAGVRTVLLESGYGTDRLEMEVTPDYIRKDLTDVMELL